MDAIILETTTKTGSPNRNLVEPWFMFLQSGQFLLIGMNNITAILFDQLHLLWIWFCQLWMDVLYSIKYPSSCYHFARLNGFLVESNKLFWLNKYVYLWNSLKRKGQRDHLNWVGWMVVWIDRNKVHVAGWMKGMTRHFSWMDEEAMNWMNEHGQAMDWTSEFELLAVILFEVITTLNGYIQECMAMDQFLFFSIRMANGEWMYVWLTEKVVWQWINGSID